MPMQTFLLLLLGHFVADYLLQPRQLVNWKNHAKSGLLIHVAIHFLVYFALLLMVYGTWWAFYPAFLLAAFHLLIDWLKIQSEKQTIHFYRNYWLDQIAHYLTLGLISFGFSNYLGCGPICHWLNPFWLLFFSLLIFSTFTIEFGELQKKRQPGQVTLPRPHFNHKKIAIRVALLVAAYLALTIPLLIHSQA